jgi:hypothetical protein
MLEFEWKVYKINNNFKSQVDAELATELKCNMIRTEELVASLASSLSIVLRREYFVEVVLKESITTNMLHLGEATEADFL